MRSTLPPSFRLWALVGLMLCTAAGAQARGHWSVDLSIGVPIGGYYNGYYGGPTYGVPEYGTVATALPIGAVSVQIGGGHYWRHGGVWYRPWGPRWVVVAPPVVVPIVPSAPAVEAPAVQPPVPGRPDPVIYPRNGQSPAQTEYDRQECNRWATTQPAALADAAVFHRAVEACMDGRGYSMK